MKLLFSRLTVAALLIAISFTVPAITGALAQSTYSDAKLESFVEAAVQIESLREQYDPQIKAADNPEKAEVLRTQAMTKMQSAVDQTPGISLDEYNEIVTAARTDPSLSERVDTMYRTAKGE